MKGIGTAFSDLDGFVRTQQLCACLREEAMDTMTQSQHLSFLNPSDRLYGQELELRELPKRAGTMFQKERSKQLQKRKKQVDGKISLSSVMVSERTLFITIIMSKMIHLQSTVNFAHLFHTSLASQEHGISRAMIFIFI